MKERGQLGAQHKVPRVLHSEQRAAGSYAGHVTACRPVWKGPIQPWSAYHTAVCARPSPSRISGL